MGGGQSTTAPHGAHSSSSGQNGSDDDRSAGEPPCIPCFFFDAGKVRGGGGGGARQRLLDPIGSPLPDTPVSQRKRREDVRAAFLQDAAGGMDSSSSAYAGLEREVSLRGGFLTPPKGSGNATAIKIGATGTKSREEDATVYEGPDCENQLRSKYELLEVLGVGSTSTVHRCIRKTTGDEFACKVIDCQLIEERFQGMMQQFQTEIEALRHLQHDNIIRLYDVFIQANDKIYIIMELCTGGELFDYVVAKGTLTEDEAAIIVRKVTSALVYMHQQAIVHRDLKPENLLLKRKPNASEPAEVKIIDFGLSKAMEEPIARTFLGTRGYLAPEMLQRRDYTKAVDTWALGVIVFVLLCGCLPFDDDSSCVPTDALVKARFVLRFPRWAKNLSPSAKDLLGHLLDVDPRTRYTAEQALEHPWVRGVTVQKGNLLASPGRIKKSPANNIGSGKTGRYIRGGRKYAPDPNRTPPTPSGPMVRKGSI
jgi:serine/threonine protein kinase